jgi:arginine decarboxylase
MSAWSIQQARDTYHIAQWSGGYFDINTSGRIVAYPKGLENKRHSIDLIELVKNVQAKGLNFPILVRFTDILKNRIRHLNLAFNKAFQEYNYQSHFLSVYPIKVNQQRYVIEAILNNGSAPVGLEAGSKSEFLAILSLCYKGKSIIICNGYKDREYISLALIAQRLGHCVYIILENFFELTLVLEEAKKIKINPTLGIRIRLASLATSKWKNSGGEKSKFGFSATKILKIIKKLRLENKLDLLKILHFHLGSQITNISDIRCAMRECACYYVECRKLGANIDLLDVGGGLGIDYEGTHSRSACSMNYSIQEYANTIIDSIAQICKKYKVPNPGIITESGRAITAHHALLITNIIAMESVCEIKKPNQQKGAILPILNTLWETYATLKESSALESYHDTCYWIAEIHNLFSHGIINLKQRAHAEKLYYAICRKVRSYLDPSLRAHREIFDELNDKLADKFLCNFSLFHSLPDAWAIDQVFPILPLTDLDKKPSRHGVLHDITCDSDGVIDTYVNNRGLETRLSLLPYNPECPYLIAIFLVGAYQEILGDIHNLFGDTASVQVESTSNGYKLINAKRGASIKEILGQVNFDSNTLIEIYQKQLKNSDLNSEEYNNYLDILLKSLHGHTYFKT